MIKAGLQWVFLIFGTIIGAGYTSGREIWQFFGAGSGLAILLFTIIFIFCVKNILLISYQAETTNYVPILKNLTGPKLTQIYDYMILVYLFCVTLVMIAGSGATFASYNLPAWWGTSFICIALYLIFRKGIHQLLILNDVLMPLLIISLLVVLFFFIRDESITLLNWERQSKWAAAFPFTALNILPLIAVLGAIGKKIKSKGEIYFAAITSGVLLGGITFLYNQSLIHLSGQMMMPDIPLFAIVNNYPFKVMIIMSIMLWFAIYTTAAATLLGLVTRLIGWVKLSMRNLVIILLILLFPLSSIGFSQLIAVLYPLYGILNLYLLVKLMTYRQLE
ncbi:YkvI family membrane protein [Oceanobacillus sp. CAU 1775]